MKKTSLIAFALVAVSVAVLAADDTKIVVGPNYLVSHDGDVPHCEMMIAANPLDPKNLVAMSIVAARPDGGWACRTYATRDGGGTWRYNDFAEQVEFGGGDPQVVFTPNGTAISLSLAFGSVKDETGKPRGGMAIYRSEDGGFNWTFARNICCSHDHPQMIVDNSNGKYAGRIYIGTLWDYPVYRIGIFRSDDDGRTWTGPVEAVNGGGDIGVNVTTTGVMSDGTLVVPYVDFEYKPEQAKIHGKVDDNAWIVKSTDGGLTFGKPIKTQKLTFDLDMREAFAVPQTAIDNRSTAFRDNLYMTWIDVADKPRVVFSRSTDRGETWSKPTALAADVPATTWQIQPSIAVNKRGVVGITWLDTRGVADHSKYDLYFAASTDGGQTFMKAVKVTTAPSIIAGDGNSRPIGSVYPLGDTGNLSLLSAANRWPNGGDYLSIAVSATDTFFPVWADARSGTFQVYTAPIRVDLPPTEEEKKRAAARAVYDPPKPPPDPAKRAEISILDKVEVIFDPGSWNSNVSELPLRLKNKSDINIYPPIKVEILDFGMAVQKRDPAFDPSILNAANSKPGKGAIFSFDQAVGADGVLRPGMLSGPVPIRLKVPDPKLAPSLQFKITGFVDK
jgi:hypothetical protein